MNCQNFLPHHNKAVPCCCQTAVVPSLVKMPKYLNGPTLATTTTSTTIPFRIDVCKKHSHIPIFRFTHSFLFLKLFVFHAKCVASVLTLSLVNSERTSTLCWKCLDGRKTICFPFTFQLSIRIISS